MLHLVYGTNSPLIFASLVRHSLLHFHLSHIRIFSIRPVARISVLEGVLDLKKCRFLLSMGVGCGEVVMPPPQKFFKEFYHCTDYILEHFKFFNALLN